MISAEEDFRHFRATEIRGSSPLWIFKQVVVETLLAALQVIPKNFRNEPGHCFDYYHRRKFTSGKDEITYR